jgi:hypothetical protein
MRLPSLFGARDKNPEARNDLESGSTGFTNEVLYSVMAAESRLISRGVRLPWGSSVFAIARRV